MLLWQALQLPCTRRQPSEHAAAGTKNNYCSGVYMFSRLFDKVLFAIFGVLYYWHVAKNMSPDNVNNVLGFLFMWCDRPPLHHRFLPFAVGLLSF